MTIRGIPIRLHYMFILFFPIIVWAFSRAQDQPFLWGAVVYLLVFSCVALHELAHSLVAQRYGLTVREIVLFPVGGVAMLEQIPEDPRKEAAIASAGPLFNLSLAAILYPVMKLLLGMEFGMGQPMREMGWLEQSLLWIFFVNVVMAVFNLIPAFPMDGGRLLRAGLVAARRPYVSATILAVKVSKFILFLFLLLGIARLDPWLLVIAFIVYSGATGEEAAVRARSSLRNFTVGHLLPQEPIGLEPETKIAEILPILLDNQQRHFPVVKRGRLAGILYYQDLAAALRRPEGAAETAGALMHAPMFLDPAEPLLQAQQKMERQGAPAACILERGRLAGIVSQDTIRKIAQMLDSTQE